MNGERDFIYLFIFLGAGGGRGYYGPSLAPKKVNFNKETPRWQLLLTRLCVTARSLKSFFSEEEEEGMRAEYTL